MISVKNRSIKKLTKYLSLTLLITLLALTAGCCSNDDDLAVPASASTYTVGGAAWWLNGSVVLQNNGADDLTVTSEWFFEFPTPLTDGSPYLVTVKTQPVTQTCYVTNGSGTVSGSDVTNISVNCYNSGSLDNSFHNDGIVTHNNAAGGNWADNGNSITVDSSGRILVTGYSWGVTYRYMVIWRYNSDGMLDTTFDSDGFIVYNGVADGSSEGRSITVDSSGRILVTGYSFNGADYDMAIWRYNSDGTLDTTFDNDGIVMHDSAAGGNFMDEGYSITVDSVGRILVTGYSRSATTIDDMVIWRYNSDGTLDTTFDNDGFVVHASAAGGNSYDRGRSITIDSSGKIVVAGDSRDVTHSEDMVIWRYNSDGTLDTTFDDDGFVTHNSAAGGNFIDLGYSIALDSSGRMLVAGTSYNGTDYDMVIWRYNSDGTLDTTFDSNGFVVYDNASGGIDWGHSIAVDTSGGIVVAGETWADMAIWRYNTDGTLDTTFDSDGIVTHNGAAGGSSNDTGNSMALDSLGRILVTGESYGSSFDMVVWRYYP
jgi:uncharacterized delta-60 repeat protein